MRKFFAKYGWTLVYLITSVVSIGMFMSIFTDSSVTQSTAMQNIDQSATADIVYQKTEVPTVNKDDFVVYNEILPLNSDFDYRDYVTVSSSNGVILNSYVSCREVVSYDYSNRKEITKRIDTAGNVYDSENHIERKFTSVAGEHELIYTLNWNGYTITKRVTFSVSENESLPVSSPLDNSSVVLVSGEAFNEKIPATAKTVRFTDVTPEWASQTYDLSEAKDAGVIGWLDGTTWYVSTRREGLKVKANEDCSKMFLQKQLTDIDLTGLDTLAVKNMSSMFNGCSSLTTLNISGIDTVNCTSMGYMFSNCSKLTSITGIENLNTAKVTDMGNMFSYCSKIEQLNLSYFNTSHVERMDEMFRSCSKLKSLEISSFNTTKVKNMTGMFMNDQALESLNVSSFSTSALTTAQNLFADCVNLKSLDLTGFNMSKVTNANGMFSNMRRLYKVTFGSSFRFAGSSSYLPSPSSTYITGADGKWYVQYSDTGYTNTNIPQNTAGTYIAVKDVSVSINGIRSKTYDGSAMIYEAVPLISEGTTLKYSLDGTNYTETKPEIKNAGNYMLYVKAINPNFADKVVTADFTVSKAPLTLSSGSASKTYDGTALRKTTEGCTLTGLVNGETATASCTGSIKDAGSTANTASVNWGTANAANYNVTKKEGTLSVAKKNVALTTNGASKTYDGKALTCASGSISGLVNGETANINYTGSQTNAGTSKNKATISWTGTAKAANYSLTSVTYGNLTVAKLSLTMTVEFNTNYISGGINRMIVKLSNGLTLNIPISGTKQTTNYYTDDGKSYNYTFNPINSSNTINCLITFYKGTDQYGSGSGAIIDSYSNCYFSGPNDKLQHFRLKFSGPGTNNIDITLNGNTYIPIY